MSIKFDPALVSGQGDYVAVDTVDADPTAYTICAWIKCITDGVIIYRTASGGAGNSHQLYVRTTGVAGAYTFDGGENHVIGTSVINDQRWHHLATSAINNGNLLLYVDGVLEGTAEPVGTLWVGGDRWRLGQGVGEVAFGGYFDGWAEDIRVWDSVLTAQQIKVLASYYPFPMGGEVHWWDCVNLQAVGHPDDFVLVVDTNYLLNLIEGVNGNPTNSPRSFASEVNPAGARAALGSGIDMYLDASIGK